ncbi:MAG: cytochrome [Frankiales bacterium]|nr:cytochrome [Frankiales bacterium]
MTTTHQIDFIDGAWWGRNPQDELTWLREHDPVHWDGRVWGITKAADVRDIATQPELFSNAQGIRPDSGPVAQMIDMDAPQHLWRRKLVSTGFTPRRVVQQEAKVLQLTDMIIDRVCEKGECDLVKDVVAWLPIEVIGGALGFNPDDFGTLLEWSDALMCALTGDPDVLERAGEAFGGYVGYLAGAVAERREIQTDDLLSILVHAEVDGNKLTDDDLLHESLLILIGGDETSRHVMSGGVYQLLTDRDQWDRLRADRSLLPSAVEEMLRWVSPIRNMARSVTEDLTFRGKDMKAGEKLVLLYPSANRDEEVFTDPFTFDIGRTPNEHLAFGVGPHFCLGNALARVEVKTMVDRLLERLPDLELVTPEEPEWRPANFVSGYEEMRVRFTPTAPVGTP